MGGGISTIPIEEPVGFAAQRYSNNKTTVEDGIGLVRGNNVMLPSIGSGKYNADL